MTTIYENMKILAQAYDALECAEIALDVYALENGEPDENMNLENEIFELHTQIDKLERRISEQEEDPHFQQLLDSVVM